MSEIASISFRDELIGWSQPLIVDQINHFYFDRLAGRSRLACELAIQHYRIWRCVLRDDLDAAAELRGVLSDNARAEGLPASLLDEADRAVLDELMDVIVSRFRRTPYIARSYGMTLLDTAANLARARQLHS